MKSIKGSQGGYFLEKAPELITVAEIVEALEGSYYLEDEEGDMSGLRGDQEAIQHLINEWKWVVILTGSLVETPVINADSPSILNSSCYELSMLILHCSDSRLLGHHLYWAYPFTV